MLAGAVAGMFGAVLFALVHAVLIVPVWRDLPSGAALAAAVGAIAGWAFEELRRARGAATPTHGLLLGAALWASLIPMTAVGAAVRLSRMRDALGTWEVAAEVGLTLGAGAAVGWLLTSNRAGSAAFAGAALALALRMGGPIPVTSGPRSALLFASFLPLCALSGAALAAARAGLGALDTWRRERTGKSGSG